MALAFGQQRRLVRRRFHLTTTADADPDSWRPATRIQCAKTGNRAWAVGSSDHRNDPYAGTRTDIYIHRSTDDGVTWLPAERADTGSAGGSESSFGGLVNVRRRFLHRLERPPR